MAFEVRSAELDEIRVALRARGLDARVGEPSLSGAAVLVVHEVEDADALRSLLSGLTDSAVTL